MKNIFATLFLILNSSISLLSQDKKIYYYDNEGFASSKADAAYYKVINYTKSGKVDGKIKDFYKSGEGLSMIDGAKEINKDDDNKSIYWGKKLQYYKNGVMKSKSLCDFEGELIYKKHWFENGNIKSFISYIPTTESIILMKFNQDGTISESNITNKDGELDPRTFNQRDGFYYTTFEEDFSNDKNIRLWDEKFPLSEGAFKEGKGYSISTTEKALYKKIIPIFDSFHNGYSFSIQLNMEAGDKNTMHGIVYNYIDSETYSCFGINASGNFCVFNVEDSKVSYEIQNKKEESINENRKSNMLSILKIDGIISFKINENTIYTTKNITNEASAFGIFTDGGKKDIIVSQVSMTYLTDYMQRIQESTLGSDGALKSGTAFMIDERGYMITNEHVIKDSRYVEVEFTWEGKTKTFPAKVVYKDAETDLAILRIISNDFKTNGALPFSILKDNVLVGSEVFTLGYPEALIIMGKEVKFTDGKISALSGIKNNKMVYQTTIPARGGNSGGAVFDNNGNIVGVLSSGRTGSEIVSYVIKSSVLINFIKQFNSDIVIKRPINLSKLPLTSKIKTLSNHVALVKIW